MKESPFMIKSKNFAIWIVEFLAVIFVLVSILFAVNRVFGEYVCEYDVMVTDVTYRFGGTAYFTNKSGEEGCVDLHDFWIIRPDDHDFVEVGDTVKVKEYVGLFGENYYVLATDEK